MHSSILSLFHCSALTSIQDYWKNHSFDYMDFCRQSNVSAFQYAVKFCHCSSSKEQASFHFMPGVTIHSDFGVQENKICHCFHFLLLICHEVMPWSMMLVFWMLSFKSAFLLSSFTLIKRLFSSSLLSAIKVYHLHIWGCWYFSQQSWFQLVSHPAQHFVWCTLHIS